MFGDRFGDGREEGRYRLGLGIGHPSVSAHFLCHSSHSLCTCRILYATGSLPIEGSVLLLFLLNFKLG